MLENQPTLGEITKTNGVAGQISYSVPVTYEDEPTYIYEFIGSVYGGPVVAVSPSGMQRFVTDPGRLGTFGPEWVRRFFAPAESV